MVSVLLLLTLFFSAHHPRLGHASSLINVLGHTSGSTSYYGLISSTRCHSDVVAALRSFAPCPSMMLLTAPPSSSASRPAQPAAPCTRCGGALALGRGDDANGTSGGAFCLALALGQGFTTTTDHDLVHDIYTYGLPVQFTPPDKELEACKGCLDRHRLTDEMPPVSFNGTSGAVHFNLVRCNCKCNLLRHEVLPFYDDGSPVVKLLAAAPASTTLALAPAGVSGSGLNDDDRDANRTRGAGNAVVLLVGVLLSTLTIFLRRKALVKQHAEDDGDSGSLLFDLTTSRRATRNFGHGGFGEVYKGFSRRKSGSSRLRSGPATTMAAKVALGSRTRSYSRKMVSVSLMNASSVVVLFMSLSCHLLLLLPSGVAAAAARAELVTWKCDNGTYYGVNSTYQYNVRSVLASLAANASLSSLFPPVGFATIAVGTSPDTVWGLGLCRGDTNGTDCGSCLGLAPDDAVRHCQGVKDVTVFYDRCILRYSFRDFLTSPDNMQVQFRGVSDDMVTTGDTGRFNALVVSLTAALSDWAAFNTTSRYAVGVITSDQGFPSTNKDVVHRINGLVQCTPDQAPATCRRCLQALIDEMPAVFNGSIGGRLLAVWCHLRFEAHEFYDDRPMLNLVAPQWTAPPSPVPTDQMGVNNRTSWQQHAATVSAIVLGVGIILLFVFTAFLWTKARSHLPYPEVDDPESLLFDLPTLKRATNNFAKDNKLGHGGFGAVYKGLLPDGREIAVKRLDKASKQGLKQLRNELLLVAKLRHSNLAKLLGVCLKGQEKMIVYEYLPNRSLDTFLFAPETDERRRVLDWETRYRIIYGTARGLLYLHEDSQTRIIHRDLKASNILLDADMNPKISDFGLARLFNNDTTASVTTTSHVVGTLGYMAPEYAALGQLSVKLDVYSFGVIILEMVAGRKNIGTFESAAEESGTLLTCVWDHWHRGTAMEAVDPCLDCQHVPESELLKCIHLGLLCVQENPADRPTMLDVLVMLHGQAASFAAPTKPAFAFASGELSTARSWDVPGDSGTQREGTTTASLLLSANEMSVSEFQPR